MLGSFLSVVKQAVQKSNLILLTSSIFVPLYYYWRYTNILTLVSLSGRSFVPNSPSVNPVHTPSPTLFFKAFSRKEGIAEEVIEISVILPQFEGGNGTSLVNLDNLPSSLMSVSCPRESQEAGRKEVYFVLGCL